MSATNQNPEVIETESGSLKQLEEDTEKLCGDTADACDAAGVSDEMFKRVLYDELKLACERIRKRLLDHNADSL